MRDWVLSDSGDKLSVKLDAPDMAGHLDTGDVSRLLLAGLFGGLLEWCL